MNLPFSEASMVGCAFIFRLFPIQKKSSHDDVDGFIRVLATSCTESISWMFPRPYQFNKSFKYYKTISFNYNTMNIPPLIPLKQAEVEKYIPKAIELTLTQKIADSESLSKQQKIIITKIYKNLNTICKLNIKQLKQVLKTEPAYQQALADLYFDKKINNYILITNYENTNAQKPKVILQSEQISHPFEVCGVQYRIQFTISNIAKKNVMKPLVLLIFKLKNGSKFAVYYNLEQFSLLRAKIANSAKQIYGIELRAL